MIPSKSVSASSHVPKFTTKRYLLKNCVELRWPVISKAFLSACVNCTSDETQKRRLMELASREGRDEYRKFCLEGRLRICDFLTAFDSCKIPFEIIVAMWPRLKYRWYSACSRPNENNTAKFAFTKIEMKEDIEESIFVRKSGLCTGMLENSEAGDEVMVVQRTSTNFILPEKHETPIMLVATGTGIAPFIGFLEERLEKYGSLGNVVLYYGCRHPDLDFLYKDKLQNYQKNDGLILNVTYSRSGEGPKYIQHLIEQEFEGVISLLEEHHGVMYICGDRSTMANELRMMLIKQTDKERVMQWTKEKQIREDLWS